MAIKIPQRRVRTGADWKLEPTYIVWTMCPKMIGMDDELKKKLGNMIDTGVIREDVTTPPAGLHRKQFWFCKYWVDVLTYQVKDDKKYTPGDLENMFSNRFGGLDAYENHIRDFMRLDPQPENYHDYPL